MPKYRILALGLTSMKHGGRVRGEKKGESDVERRLEKPQVGIPSAKIQIETNIPENTFPTALCSHQKSDWKKRVFRVLVLTCQRWEEIFHYLQREQGLE